jgi:hypothetical protein
VSCFDGRVLTCRPLWAMTCRPRTLSVVAAVLVVLVKPFAVHFYLEHLPSSSTAIWQLEVACELLKPVRPPSLLPRSRMRHEGTDQDVGDPALSTSAVSPAPRGRSGNTRLRVQGTILHTGVLEASLRPLLGLEADRAPAGADDLPQVLQRGPSPPRPPHQGPHSPHGSDPGGWTPAHVTSSISQDLGDRTP